MKVYVTYTYNEVIDVPDDATDKEIADICAGETKPNSLNIESMFSLKGLRYRLSPCFSRSQYS